MVPTPCIKGLKYNILRGFTRSRKTVDKSLVNTSVVLYQEACVTVKMYIQIFKFQLEQ